jgi:hypothetical protein
MKRPPFAMSMYAKMEHLLQDKVAYYEKLMGDMSEFLAELSVDLGSEDLNEKRKQIQRDLDEALGND